MDKIIQIIKSIISAEQKWSAFAMKITGLIVVAVIAYIAFQQYTNLTADEDNQNIPIIEVFEAQPEKKDEVEDLSYTQLRSRLPQEISNDIVQLLANSKQALLDFANIQTPEDIASFNQQYEVNLTLPTGA